jgi:hypothetical protein
MGVRSEYGFTKQEQDHALFYNKKSFEILFEGSGTADNSPDVNLYLLIDGKYQGLYVPEGIVAAVTWEIIHVTGTTYTVQTEQGIISRVSGGNVAYTGGAIGTIDPTVTPTANTTAGVQCIELVVSDADSEQLSYVRCLGRFLVIDTNATGQSRSPTATTAARTTAE